MIKKELEYINKRIEHAELIKKQISVKQNELIKKIENQKEVINIELEKISLFDKIIEKKKSRTIKSKLFTVIISGGSFILAGEYPEIFLYMPIWQSAICMGAIE